MTLERGYWKKRNNLKRLFLLGLNEQAEIISSEFYSSYDIVTFRGLGYQYKTFYGIHLDDGSLVAFRLEMDRG